jgi:uncharacterized protein (TIGR02453 family)
MMFSGFSKKTSDFLWGLKLNNEKPWFEAHKAEYEADLKVPFGELARDTFAAMAKRHPEMEWNLHVASIYRDARRLHGNGPYKDHLWFSVKDWDGLLEGPMFWFEIGAADYGYGMGFYSASPAQMEAFRASLRAEPARFRRLTDELAAQKVFQPELYPYARPKGDLGPELNPWYNSRRIGLNREENFGRALYSPKLPERLAEDFELLLPMYSYLCTFCREEPSAEA